MQRLLISLAFGIVVVFSLLFVTILTYKILFPGSTVIVWVLGWPALLFGSFFSSLSRNVLIVSAMLIALIFYIGVATVAIFLLLKLFGSRRADTEVSFPPAPPSF